MNRLVRLPVVLALVALAGWLVAGYVDFRSDLSFATPRVESGHGSVLAGRLDDKKGQGLLLLAISGGVPEGRAWLSAELADRLRRNDRFRTVANGAGPLPRAQIEYLFENRYLLGPELDPEEFSVAALKGSLADNLDLLSTSTGQAWRRYMPADPTRRLKDIAGSFRPATEPEKIDGVWVTSDGETAVLVAQGAADTYDLDAQAGLLAHIREIFDALSGTGRYRLRVTGPGSFAVATRARIQNNVAIMSAVSLALLLGIFWGGFRKLSLAPGLVLPMAIGVLAGLVAVQTVDGYVHGITLAFGVCLVGIAVDYPVHIVAHAARAGSARAAVSEIWPTLRLSAMTTVIAFAPFVLSDFPGLSQIGMFVAAGLVCAVAASRYLFPAYCPVIDHLPISERVLQRLRRWRGRLRLPLLAASAAAAGSVVFHWGGLWQAEISELSPVPTELIRLDREIRQAVGAPDVRYMVILQADTVDRVLEMEERLRPVLARSVADGAIASYRMAADLLPSLSAQESRIGRLPEDAVLRGNFASAISGTPFRPGSFEPFFQDMSRAREAAPVSFESFRQSAAGDAIEGYILQSPTGWSGVVSLSGVEDAPKLFSAVEGAGIPGVFTVDLKTETESLVWSFLYKSLQWLGVALAVVALLLAVVFRRPKRVLRILGPVMLSLVMTVGALAALDVRLSLFHVLSLILVAGLGMDYGLFFSRQHGGDAVTLRAMIVCNATTAAVFLVMAFSPIPVLHGIGMTVALGAFLAFAASAVFAPDEG